MYLLISFGQNNKHKPHLINPQIYEFLLLIQFTSALARSEKNQQNFMVKMSVNQLWPE
jgi:hypothetical protein